MKKQKRSQKFVTYIVIGIFTCLLIAIASLLIAMVLPSESSYRETSQATAQFLEQYPAAQPSFIRVDENCNERSEHCFWIMADLLPGSTDANHVVRVARSLVVTIDGQFQADYRPVQVESYLYGDVALEAFGSGLHLIEVQIQDEDGRIYTHAWTVRTEDGDVSAPPTLAVPPTYSTAVPDGE